MRQQWSASSNDSDVFEAQVADRVIVVCLSACFPGSQNRDPSAALRAGSGTPNFVVYETSVKSNRRSFDSPLVAQDDKAVADSDSTVFRITQRIVIAVRHLDQRRQPLRPAPASSCLREHASSSCRWRPRAYSSAPPSPAQADPARERPPSRHAGRDRADQRPCRPFADWPDVSLTAPRSALPVVFHQPCVVSLSCVPV